ncbi:MAG: hypothetical protein ABI693_30135 [Bryobacteraceae bacterium]
MADVRASRNRIVAAAGVVGCVVAAVSVTASGPVAVAEACLAHLGVCLFSVWFLMNTSAWRAIATPIVDGGWPSLRSLAWVTPVLLAVQVLLGSGYRHHVLGVMPHVAAAIVTGLTSLMFGIFTIMQSGGYRPVRFPGHMLAGFTGLQVFLGAGSLIARLAPIEGFGALAIAPPVHVAMGAMTLASGVVTALQVLRNFQPPAVEVSRTGATVAQ